MKKIKKLGDNKGYHFQNAVNDLQHRVHTAIAAEMMRHSAIVVFLKT